MTKTATRERPIRFRGPMVRAILDGRKTQTRRVSTTEIPVDADELFVWPRHEVLSHHNNPGLWARKGDANEDNLDGWVRFLCTSPFGHYGDRLWVQETWTSCAVADGNHHGYAHESGGLYEATGVQYRADFAGIDDDIRWRPSTQMQRWASRITLGVTDVRVERLRDISEDDALAEGVDAWVEANCWDHYYDNNSILDAYALMWDSDAKLGYSWESNPFVWCITFRAGKWEAAPPKDQPNWKK